MDFLDELNLLMDPAYTPTSPRFIRPPDPEPPETARDLEAISKALAAQEARLLKRGAEVPQWLMDAGIAIKWSGFNQRWVIQLKVTSRVKEVLYRDVWVHRPTMSRNFTVGLWLPLEKDGGYRMSQLAVADERVTLPHISSGMACLSLGDAPLKVASVEEYKKLASSISRGLEQVNLSSLLSYEKMHWPKEVRMAIPSDVRRHIGRRRMGHIPQQVLEKYFVRLQAEREEEIWQTTSMGLRLP